VMAILLYSLENKL